MYLKIGKVAIFVLSLAFASRVVYGLCYKRKTEKVLTPSEINEVLMFTQRTKRLTMSEHSRSLITTNMARLLDYLASTRYNIDICMYAINNDDIIGVIIKLHNKGVLVRIITDEGMLYATRDAYERFYKAGVPIRLLRTSNVMHHKFCVIDAWHDDSTARPLVMMGSMNWTNNAFYGNWENVTITSTDIFLTEYQSEFERLWDISK